MRYASSRMISLISELVNIPSLSADFIRLSHTYENEKNSMEIPKTLSHTGKENILRYLIFFSLMSFFSYLQSSSIERYLPEKGMNQK
jgi:hypothetical protein